MSGQTLYPTAIAAATGLSGDLGALTDDPASPDAAWLTPGYQPGVLYRLTPSGPAYATEAETVAAIIAESTKAYTNADRPLPLIGHWVRNALPLSWQLDRIAEGYPFLPWVDYSRTQTVEQQQVTADAMPALAAAGLPLTCITGGQWEYDLYSQAAYQNLSDTDTAQAVMRANVTAAVANGSTSITITTAAAHYIGRENWNLGVGTTVSFDGMPGGWAALNGSRYTIASKTATTVTINIDGSGFGAYTSGGRITGRSNEISLMGSVSTWATLGATWTDHAAADWLQEQYPNPPRVLIFSNNEAASVGVNEIDVDARFVDNVNPTPTDLIRCREYHYRYIDRYNAMIDAMRANLGTANWRAVATFAPYGGSAISIRFRAAPNWFFDSGCDPDYFTRSASSHFAWGGSVPGNYDNDWQWAPRPIYLWSQQHGSSCRALGRDIQQLVNPSFWHETLVWDGELWPGGGRDTGGKGVSYSRNGYSLSPSWYKGWTQYCLWVEKGRVLREFRGAGTNIQAEPYASRFRSIIDAVCHVHQHPTLRRFWRSGVQVENTEKPHPFMRTTGDWSDWTVSGAQWETTANGGPYPKNYHLTTNLDAAYPSTDAAMWDVGTLVQPVYTQAHVLGSAPNREWLVYAHSTSDATLNDLEVTIPDYQTITLPSVPTEGAFYYVVE